CMPKLQELIGAKGVRFIRNYASTPLCCPGRSTVLTGKYAHNHGVRTNGDVEEGDTVTTAGAIDFQQNGNEEIVFAKALRAAGYRTGLIGKYLNGYERQMKVDTDGDGIPDHDRYVPPYWDDWHVFDGPRFFNFRLIEKDADAALAKRVCYLSTT